VGAAILSLLTLLPLGALDVFEFKTVDVRFWVRERLVPAPERRFVQVIELPEPGPGEDRGTVLSDLTLNGFPRLLQTAGSPIVWVLPAGVTLPPAPEAVPRAGAGRRTRPRLPEAAPSSPILWGGPEQLDFALDTDGIVRRIPLVLPDGSGAGLVLEAVCALEGALPPRVRVQDGTLEILRHGDVLRRIPVDSNGQLLVNFANRPAGSIWSVDSVTTQFAADPQALRQAVAGKLLLLGWGTRGPRDGSAIPLARVASDLEVTAEAAETVLSQHWIHRPSVLLTFVLTWALLFFGSQVMMRLSSWRAVLAGLGLMVVYIGVCHAAFLVAGVWLDLLRPLLAFQLGAIIFPVVAYRSRTHHLVDQMRLLRRFDDLVLMNVAKGLLVAGRHGMVVRHNPQAAELLGLAGQSLHGRHIRELLAVSPAMLELVGRAMAAGEGGDTAVPRKLPISTRVSLADGDQERVLELEVALVDPRILHSIEEEDLPCYVLTFDDVTQEVHRAKEEAQRARLAAMGEIAAKLGHEIRNSLGGLRLYVDNISEEVAQSPAAQRAVEGMVREIETLYRKIDELRQYGAAPRLHRETCDLKELMQEAIHFAHRRLGEKNVTAVLDCERRFPPLFVDRRQLREAFVNLINNAIDAAPPGGQVEIHCDHENGASDTRVFRIHFEDDGPGIPIDIRDQVFSLFFTTKEDTGTGLGLPMVKKIVESHGGEVSFTCGESGGTRFTVTLPAQPVMNEVES